MHSQYSEFQEELDRLWSKYTRWDVVADNHSWNEDVCKKAMDLAEMFYAQYQALLVKARAAQAKRVVMVSTPAAASNQSRNRNSDRTYGLHGALDRGVS